MATQVCTTDLFFVFCLGPSFGLGNSPANKITPIRPKQSETQNPGFTLPNFKNSSTIPGFGSLEEVNTTVENGNSALRPDAPSFKPGRPGERNNSGPFEPPAPQRLLQPNSFTPEKGPRPFDGPQGDRFAPGRPRGDFEGGGPQRESWDEPRGPPDDFKPPNWRDQGPNDFGHRGRDFRPDDGGPNFRGPPGDRFHGPDRQGILGSPPTSLDMDSRPGLLGAPPTQQPQQLMQGPPGPQGGPTGPARNDFPQGTLAQLNFG